MRPSPISLPTACACTSARAILRDPTPTTFPWRPSSPYCIKPRSARSLSNWQIPATSTNMPCLSVIPYQTRCFSCQESSIRPLTMSNIPKWWLTASVKPSTSWGIEPGDCRYGLWLWDLRWLELRGRECRVGEATDAGGRCCYCQRPSLGLAYWKRGGLLRYAASPG
jgi:hypothetical protein